MHPVPALGLAFALERERDLSEQAKRAPLRRDVALARSTDAVSRSGLDSITVRRARVADATGLRRLAELDDASADLAALARSGREEPLLVAEAGGSIVAAFDPSRGLLVADPFRHTAAAAELLRVRARQLRGDHARTLLPLRAMVRGRLRPRTG